MRVNFTSVFSVFLPRLLMLALLLGSLTFTSIAQTGRRVNKDRLAGQKSRAERKMNIERTGSRLPVQQFAADDIGGNTYAAGYAGVNVNRTEAICAVFTGTITAADPTFTSGRLTRNGVTSSCAAPKICPGSFSPGTTYRYRTHTFTNPLAIPQCITVTHQNTGASGAPHLSIHNGVFDPANICTNYLADFGSSPLATFSVTFTFTLPASATITLVVTETAVGGLGSYSVTLDGCQPACDGTPAPGNTISTVPSVCPGINFTLSLQNTTTGAGVNYQWQRSASASGPWTNFGSNTATQVTNQAAATYYQCVVTCIAPGGGSGTSEPVQVTMNPPLSCYCLPPASDCTDDDVILRVRLSTLDNASTCGTGPPAGYTNYTTTVAAPIVFAGAANPIIVNVPTTYTEQLAVWIDYNVNGIFEASEYTNLGSSAGTGGTVTGNINIPSTVASGTTRMRVRVRYATALGSGDACTGYFFGETEDYNVDIQPCVPATITGNPANMSIACGENASFTVIASGSLPAYTWQFRPNASAAWQNVPDVHPFSGINTSVLSLNNVPETYTGYQFRALVSGGCSGLDFSGTATLTVSPVVPLVNPATATICTDSVQPLSLTNTIANTELLSEGWSVVSPLPAGWFAKNNSSPVGTTGWFQGNPAAFPSYNGAANTYIAANFQNTGGANTISNWLLTPEQPIKNGDILTFWTRTIDDPLFPDRLEVRLSTNAASTNVGATSTSVGDFTTLLLTINPMLTLTGYPSVWTQYTATVSGLAAPVIGRFAFRYFVTDGGPSGNNSDYIGIDDIRFTAAGGPAEGIWTGPAGTMWADAAATIPYTGNTANTIWVTPDSTSNYGVSFTTLTPCMSALTNVPVNVVQPVALVSSPEDRSACIGGTATFTVTASGGPLSYQWQRSTDGGLTYSDMAGAVSSSLTITNISLSMNGYRYRCVIGAAPCVGSVTSAAAVLSVLSQPVVTLSSPDLQIIPGSLNETSITATSTPAAAVGGWIWTYNGNVIAGNNTNMVSGIGVDELGTYQATVTDINGCQATSATIVVGGEPSDRLWIYPNPSEGQFQVRLYYDPASVAEIRGVYIYNAQGQLVDSKEFLLYNSAPYLRMDFDLSRQADGVYVVKALHKHTGRTVSGMLLKQSR
ncbi:MAG: choice-of-anchor J domain-containing protein [Chitinophagaceae bacterium]|nr:choice-of-anchor J domain-containing protein [Chitinophagaceae bacterium]